MLAHNFLFDPTYGYTLDTLLSVPAPAGPADFADFWRSTYEQSRQIPLRLEYRRVPSKVAALEVYEVEYDSLDGVRIGGWFTVPVGKSVKHGLVVGHGYGGRTEPALARWEKPRVSIFPCARGFHRSAHPGLPDISTTHVVHGIEHRDTYLHRGCVADYWAAASALLELYPSAAKNLHYHGASFGGGIGALMLPWDPRFHKGHLDLPSFGNHPLRVQLPCTGSGAAVRQYYQSHPEVLDVLAYFDAATAARYMKIPVLVAAAKFDPAVPPPGQFAVYNGLPGQKELFVRVSGHFPSREEPPEYREIMKKLQSW